MRCVLDFFLQLNLLRREEKLKHYIMLPDRHFYVRRGGFSFLHVEFTSNLLLQQQSCGKLPNQLVLLEGW